MRAAEDETMIKREKMEEERKIEWEKKLNRNSSNKSFKTLSKNSKNTTMMTNFKSVSSVRNMNIVENYRGTIHTVKSKFSEDDNHKLSLPNS